jgi:hypothetical protein
MKQAARARLLLVVAYSLLLGGYVIVSIWLVRGLPLGMEWNYAFHDVLVVTGFVLAVAAPWMLPRSLGSRAILSVAAGLSYLFVATLLTLLVLLRVGFPGTN